MGIKYKNNKTKNRAMSLEEIISKVERKFPSDNHDSKISYLERIQDRLMRDNIYSSHFYDLFLNVSKAVDYFINEKYRIKNLEEARRLEEKGFIDSAFEYFERAHDIESIKRLGPIVAQRCEEYANSLPIEIYLKPLVRNVGSSKINSSGKVNIEVGYEVMGYLETDLNINRRLGSLKEAISLYEKSGSLSNLKELEDKIRVIEEQQNKRIFYHQDYKEILKNLYPNSSLEDLSKRS